MKENVMKMVRLNSRIKTGLLKDNVRLRKKCYYVFVFMAMLIVTASALHYDKPAVSFTTLDEFYSPGKELKVWSDTTVRILAVSFASYYDPSSPSSMYISWEHKASRSIPCTLSVGDTLKLKLYATYIRTGGSTRIDSICFATGPGQWNYVPLQVASFPHAIVTSNSFSGPTADTVGKCLHFSRDSVFCTLRHPVYYSYYWGDRFETPWSTARSALHSWSSPGQYSIKAIARCSDQLYTDTLKSLLTLIAPVPKNVASGTYKSGFLIRMVGAGNNNVIDLSEGANGPVLDSDLVFDKTGNNISAKAGVISLGFLDSLPKLSNINCAGVPSETTAVCKSVKQEMDSLVGALKILCPSVIPDTAITTMHVGQFCLVKTREGHYVIMIKIGEYIGGIDREYYYWGYQSDGSRLLNPGVSSVADEKKIFKVQSGTSKIRMMRQGKYVRLVLPDDRVGKEVSIYKCNGTMIHHAAIIPEKEAVVEFTRMNSGLFIVSVKTDRGVLREVVRLF
jgi:hypothetical protein